MAMNEAPWPAPAKINLFLHVTGRREDGYHLLQTLFQFLSRCDEIAIRLREDRRLVRIGGLAEVPPEEDLVIRAARLLAETTGVRRGAEIELTKLIPHGGGLGGGSSDAATVLVALNELWETGLDTNELAELGLRLGADVPVFVHGYAAWAEGVGERLEVVEPVEPWYLVVTPPVAVSTAEVFAAPELTRNTPPATISDFLSGSCGNDCEAVVCARYPEVGEALEWLRGRGAARMTGTGSSLFLPFATLAEASRVQVELPARWLSFIARGMNRSPLLDRLQRERDRRR
ncbi:MAG TPA: 4-(cytidine 5'-diphospho)-2-C-methyl-D-erythritol kinase [Thiotrichales bacterium]|nr:4-(cytidine 5'-diphospho)-2-C-methyl-D-erythritol kinase [Thiotrichales bacterium]